MSEALKCKVRRKNLVDDDQLQKLIDSDCKLLTSKQFAQLVNLKTDAALRKQRSKNRSLFPYSRIGRRIFYISDLIVKTLHDNIHEAQLR